MADFRMTLTVEIDGQQVTLIDERSSGDNERLALHDAVIGLFGFRDQLNDIIPAMVGSRQHVDVQSVA